MRSLWMWLLDRLVYRVRPLKRYAQRVGEIVGYGPVNHWADVDPWKLARALVKAGHTAATIELLGWAASYTSPRKIAKPYRAWLEAMRHYRIVTLVSLANDNKGQGKYGDDRRPLEAFNDDLWWAVEMLIDCGDQGVIVQAVAETQSAYGSRFEADSLALLHKKGFRCCWNHGSRPRAPQAGCAYFAYHPTGTGDTGPFGGITVTDCGTILRELQNGDVYGLGNPDVVAAYARRVHEGGRGFLYYGFGHWKIDGASIEAIGKACR